MAYHQFGEHGIEGQDIVLSLLVLELEALHLRVLVASRVVSRHRYKVEFDIHCHHSHRRCKQEEFGCRCHRSRHRRTRAGSSHRSGQVEASLLNLCLALDWGLDSVPACLREPRSRKAL